MLHKNPMKIKIYLTGGFFRSNRYTYVDKKYGLKGCPCIKLFVNKCPSHYQYMARFHDICLSSGSYSSDQIEIHPPSHLYYLIAMGQYYVIYIIIIIHSTLHYQVQLNRFNIFCIIISTLLCTLLPIYNLSVLQCTASDFDTSVCYNICISNYSFIPIHLLLPNDFSGVRFIIHVVYKRLI